MGYFPNGTSGEIFQDAFCSRCIHDVEHNCPVWLAHLVTDYIENGETSKGGMVLDYIIPNDCSTCKMFIPVEE